MSKEKNDAKKKKEPLVSILIPAYNGEKYIYGAISSALLQTHKNIEIIVLDDASTDETANICKSFGDRIIYLKNEKNMGIGYGRWKLSEEATGDYIVFCSQDDILSNMFVEKMLEEMGDDTDKVLYCGYFIIDELGRALSQNTSFGFEEHDDFCVSCYESALRQTMFVNFSCILVPKGIARKVEYDPEIRYGEDLEWLLKAALVEDVEFKHVPMSLTKYRKHEGMVTKKKWNMISENNMMIMKKVEDMLEKKRGEA